MRMTQNTYSRAGIAAAVLCALMALCLVWTVKTAGTSTGANVTAVTVPATAAQQQQTLLSDGTKPATLADMAIKLVFAAGYHRGDDLGQTEAFDDVMHASAFQKASPVDPETGEKVHGYFARSVFDGFDFIERPYADPNNLWKSATELHMYWKDGALHGNFGGQFHTYRFDDGASVRAISMNVVFDLPSGGHKYMQIIGYQATDDGVVIDDSYMPLMLGYIMTSQYMHIFIPSYDDAGKTELVFWTDSFKDLLSASDRTQAEAAQAKADKETPATYDNEEENSASPRQGSVAGSH